VAPQGTTCVGAAMGCVPGSVAGVARGSALLLVGILTNSRDARQLGREVILGSESASDGYDEHRSPREELAELESMRRELEQRTEDLVRCKAEGSSAACVAELQREVEQREAQLREMEARCRRLEEGAQYYPPPLFLRSADDDGTPMVAIAGCSGVGKSLLVNSMRRAKYGDPAYALVGTRHTTVSPAMYPLRGALRARLWDLPGAGSRHYPRDAYPRAVGLRHFDIVLLVTGSRFTQTDADIFQGLCKHSVPTLVVRTKVDLDVASAAADSGQAPAETLQNIRDDLKSKGVFRPYLVSTRRPEEHDFPQLMTDLRKALAARSLGVPHRTSSQPSLCEDSPSCQGMKFKVGDAAEVILLEGPHTGSWESCLIAGMGTREDRYVIAFPDAPEKCDVLEVHVSALRRASEPPTTEEEEEKQLLDLQTVMQILGAFKKISVRRDIQTTLAALENHGLQTLKHKFVAEALGPALSGMDVSIPNEVSPLLFAAIQSHQCNICVREIAHEVESLLNLGVGELFGIPAQASMPQHLRCNLEASERTGSLAIGSVAVRSAYQLAGKFGESWLMLWSSPAARHAGVPGLSSAVLRSLPALSRGCC